MDLVARIVVGRKVLDAVERRVRDPVEVFDGCDAELGEVLRRRLLDRNVRGTSEADLVRLVERRLEQVAVDAEDFDPVRAVRFRPLHAGPDRLRRLGRPAGAPAPARRVDENPRRDQRVRRAVGPPLLRLLELRPDVAHGGHAASQQQVGLVMERLRHAAPLVLQVHVGVDDAGHDVLAGRIDDRVGRRVLRRRGADAGDQAVLDDDVRRAEGGLRVPVDDHRVPDQQPRDRLRVHGRFRCRGGRLDPLANNERQPCQQSGADKDTHGASSGHATFLRGYAASPAGRGQGRNRCIIGGMDVRQKVLFVDAASGFYRIAKYPIGDFFGPVDLGLHLTGRFNSLNIGVGLLAGSILPGSNRLVVTGFSPCWGGFFISSMGGAGLIFDNLGINMLSLVGSAATPSVLVLNRQNGEEIDVSLEPVDLPRVWASGRLGVYALLDGVHQRYTTRYSEAPRILAVGPAAEATDFGGIVSVPIDGNGA